MNCRNGMLALIGGLVLGLGLARYRRGHKPSTRNSAPRRTSPGCLSTISTVRTACCRSRSSVAARPPASTRSPIPVVTRVVRSERWQRHRGGHQRQRVPVHVNATAGLQVAIGESTVVTEVATAELIGLGSAPNEIVDVVMHLVFDANGNLVNVIVDKATARCVG